MHFNKPYDNCLQVRKTHYQRCITVIIVKIYVHKGSYSYLCRDIKHKKFINSLHMLPKRYRKYINPYNVMLQLIFYFSVTVTKQ